MSGKEVATKEDIMTTIDILEGVETAYWIDGGWGVDILVEKQTRGRRDIDVNFGSRYTEELLYILSEYGYEIDTGWKSVRMELHSGKCGYLDIHPFVLYEGGTAK